MPLTEDAIRLAVPPRGEAWAHRCTGSRTPPPCRGWWSRAGRPPGTSPSRPAASAGFEPDVRFETADLQAHIALIESGNAVALIPDLMRARRAPDVRLVDLAGTPRRTVFTAARRSTVGRPAIAACRAPRSAAAAKELSVVGVMLGPWTS